MMWTCLLWANDRTWWFCDNLILFKCILFVLQTKNFGALKFKKLLCRTLQAPEFWNWQIINSQVRNTWLRYTGTGSEEETWAGGTWFSNYRRRAYVKTKQVNSLKDVIFVLNDMWMFCDCGEMHVGWFNDERMRLWNILDYFLLLFDVITCCKIFPTSYL